MGRSGRGRGEDFHLFASVSAGRCLQGVRFTLKSRSFAATHGFFWKEGVGLRALWSTMEGCCSSLMKSQHFHPATVPRLTSKNDECVFPSCGCPGSRSEMSLLFLKSVMTESLPGRFWQSGIQILFFFVGSRFCVKLYYAFCFFKD